MHTQKDGQVVLDLDIKWGGDPNIVLGISAVGLDIPVQVHVTPFCGTN